MGSCCQSAEQTDGRTLDSINCAGFVKIDTKELLETLHRPCSTYYARSIKKWPCSWNVQMQWIAWIACCTDINCCTCTDKRSFLSVCFTSSQESTPGFRPPHINFADLTHLFLLLSLLFLLSIPTLITHNSLTLSLT